MNKAGIDTDEGTRGGNRSLIYCPHCKKPTYTYLRHGDVAIWCRHCRRTFEAFIKGGSQGTMQEEAEQEQGKGA